MAERLRRFEHAEGVVFIGKAREKTAVARRPPVDFEDEPLVRNLRKA